MRGEHLGRFLAQLDLVVTKDCGQSAAHIRHQLADSFVAGYTDFDWITLPTPHEEIDLVAWAGITKEWLRSDLNVDARIADILGVTTTGYNAPSYLNGASVHDDSAIDTLAAPGGLALVFANTTGGGLLDLIQDKVDYGVDV